MVLIDAATGFCFLVAASDKSSSSTIKALEHVFAVSGGVPESIRTDDAKEFTSNELRTFLEKNGVKHETGSPYNQRSNGVAERMVGRVKQQLLRMCRDNRACGQRRSMRRRARSTTRTRRSVARHLRHC